MTTRSEILNYIIKEYYSKDLNLASDLSGYNTATIKGWLAGTRTPQKNTLEYFIQCAFVPEFKVIAEFAEFDSRKPLQTQLKTILTEHWAHPGIYAFYDSMGNLI
jgi:hypothetical protein